MGTAIVPALLWDVQEEHLNEAEFSCEAWNSALDSPVFSLHELRRGPEERLMANIMGLVIGGQPVFDQLVRPVLDEDLDDDRYRTAAAALALLDGAGRDAPALVLAYLDQARAAGRWGIARAVRLSRRTDLAEHITASLGEHSGPALLGRMRALSGLGRDPGKALRPLLKHELPQVRRHAAYLARYSSSSKVLKRLIKLMRDPDELLRVEALESGLIRGLPGSWQLACQMAFAPGACSAGVRRRALGWVAMQGDAEVHARLLAELRAKPSPELLWAAGITGRPEAAALAVELLDDRNYARLAGELLCFIAGLPTRSEALWLDEGAHGSYGADADEALPPLVDDDLDADLVPPEDLRLRLPNAAAVREWWSNARAELDPSLRYYAGQPLQTQLIAYALDSAPMRRRHAIALELAIRSAGLGIVDTRAPARVQIERSKGVFDTLQQYEQDGRGRVDFQGGLPLV